MKSKEKDYFNKIADSFDARFNAYSRRAVKLRIERRLELFTRNCKLKSDLKILEIGCGTGEYAKGLFKFNNTKLFCTDISYNMLHKAIAKLVKQNNLYFFVSDIENLPLTNEAFDVVLGNSVLHHLDVKKALGQIRRVLKIGGRFAFSEPNMLNPQIVLQKNIKFIKNISGDSPEETAFTRMYIKRLLEETGFRDISVEPFDFLHPSTPALLVKIVNKMGSLLEQTFLIREIAGSLFMTGVK